MVINKESFYSVKMAAGNRGGWIIGYDSSKYLSKPSKLTTLVTKMLAFFLGYARKAI